MKNNDELLEQMIKERLFDALRYLEQAKKFP